MPENKATVRERLLLAADELFYREGIHTVGIDRVLEHAGVAKASLYSTFGSKDELVRAYLENRAAELKQRIGKRLAAVSDPRDRIVAVFDVLVDRVKAGGYYGCAFMRACAEAESAPATAQEVASAFRQWRCELFAQLARDAGVVDADAAGRQLTVIYDGASVGALMNDGLAAAEAARAAVAALYAEPPKTKRVRKARAK